VKTGKLKCEQCHGGQGSSDKLPALQRDRISGYSREVWESMKMDDCIDCHSSRGLAHSCLDCHK
jgi:hypothetical protein